MKVCLISSGFDERNRMKQPWLYLLQGAHALNHNGHKVFLVSDGYPRLAKMGILEELLVIRIHSTREWFLTGNKLLESAIDNLRPDIVIWHLGLTSFFRLNTLFRLSAPVIGIFTSPIYKPEELLRLGAMRLLKRLGLSAVHLVGLFIPSAMIQRTIKQGSIKKLVIESEITRKRLMEKGISANSLRVIKPYIDPIWFQERLTLSNRIRVREELGFSRDDFVVAYFGPPTPLRGLPVLIDAFNTAIQKNPHLRLLVLSRQNKGEQNPDYIKVLKLIKNNHLLQKVHLMPGTLSKARLIQYLSVCDVIALPFQLVPSDIPISILEAMTLEIPLITSDVACLVEMVPEDTGLRLPPGDSNLLAEAILKLSSDSKLREKLSRRGKEHVLSWTSISESNRAWNNLVLSNETEL